MATSIGHPGTTGRRAVARDVEIGPQRLGGTIHLPAGRCPKELRIVPKASQLFEEPGKLDEVIVVARQWFVDHLTE